jgi:CspA family cold shock protein
MNFQSRIDVKAELEISEHLRRTEESLLDQELFAIGVDAMGLQDRLEPVILARHAGAASGVAVGAGTTKSHPAEAGHNIGLRLSRDTMSFVSTDGPHEAGGPVKFFDSNKGYGFIAGDHGLGDILVHIKTLEAAGYRTLYEGTRVHVLAQRTPRGYQAIQILSIDDSMAVHPSQLPARTHVKVAAESDWARAIVKFYDRIKGYGFVQEGPDLPDCFVHADTLRRWGMGPLRPGQVVEMRWGKGKKGRMVAEIRHVGGVNLPPVH